MEAGRGRSGGGGDFAGKRIALISTQWNPEIVGSMLRAARARLAERGIEATQVREFEVPGAFEIPLLCERLARSNAVDAIVALGCVIKGDTAHFEYVAGECARGMAEVARQHCLPIGFGVLATFDVEQARARSADDKHNKGIEAVDAVLDMLCLLEPLGD